MNLLALDPWFSDNSWAIPLVGLLAFTLCALGFRSLGAKSRRGESRSWGLSLIVAALIYVGFALLGGGGGLWLAVEAGGLLVFSALAVIGGRRSPTWLAGGWALHAVWDLALHHDVVFVPGWYPLACLVFDLAAAAWILHRARYWPDETR